MFRWFGENKANYEKGQIFPLVIAALAILIVMAMITANLGKLAIYKTDVSNAADAGALAGASVLSAYLLGVGLSSDTWCGTAVVTAARCLEIAVLGRDDIRISDMMSDENEQASTNDTSYYDQFINTMMSFIKLYIQHLVHFYEAYITIFEESMMTWANAKQTALRAAFQNSGVDEQPPLEWKNYSRQGMGTYDQYVNEYLKDESHQGGFSRFMAHPVTGYGQPLGQISAGTVSPMMVTSGYGWTQNADESFSGSFPGSNNYTGFDNWVKVQVQGSVLFPIEALSFADYFGPDAVTGLTAIVGIGSYCKYVGWTGGEGDDIVNDLKEYYGLGYVLAGVFAAATAAAFNGMIKNLPSGLKFKDDNEALYTDQNPIVVQVTRYKKGQNLGMWNFQYGSSGVHARSAAHACRKDASNNASEDITIKPVLIDSIKDISGFLGAASGSFSEMWENPYTIVTMVTSAFCMGLTFGSPVAASYYMYCNMFDCAMDYIEDILLVWFVGAGLAFVYLAYAALCGESSTVLNPQSGDATMNDQALGGIDTSDWFHTELHLYETELYPGYIE